MKKNRGVSKCNLMRRKITITISCLLLVMSNLLAVPSYSKTVRFDLNQQQSGKRITGTVTDTSGEPIIGANVVEKGTTNGNITDVNGKFTLEVSSGATLVISYIGYNAQEAAVGNQTNLKIMLAEKSQALEEIVVVGYGIQQKRDITGNISNIKGDQIKNLPVTSASNALQGRVSGVDFVNTSSDPSAQPNIRIRGTGTVNGAEPLVVIDGVPSGNLRDINPNDIESIEILKDASSSAIYGTRAANGVIIITTKRGERNTKVNVDVNVYSAFVNVYKKLDLLTAPDLVMLKKERYTNDGNPVDAFWNDPYYATQRTDWQDAMFGQGQIWNGDVRISGGSDKSNYMTSIGIFDEQGILYNSNFNRINFRANSDHQPNDRLKISQSFQFVHSKAAVPDTRNTQHGRIWSGLRFNPALPVMDENGKWGASTVTELGDINNPVYELHTQRYSTTINSILASLNLSYKFAEGLYLNLNGGFDGNIQLDESFSPKVTEQMRQSEQAEMTKSYTQGMTALSEAYLSYLKTFASVHKINVTAGVSYQNFSGMYFSAQKRDFTDESDDQLVFDNGSTLTGINGNFRDEVKLASAYGRLFYSLKDRYMLTATFRSDGSSRFAPEKRWGYFPAFSVGWRISEESFMPKSDFLNDLKILGGWGSLGNQDINAFQYVPLMVKGSVRQVIGGKNLTGSSVSMLANPNITWEKTNMTNVSIEARMFNNQLNATITWFNKKTFDMLIATPTMNAQGKSPVPASNVGEMSNKGWEFEVGYNKRVSQDFNWFAATNVSFIKNNVDRLYGTDDTFLSGPNYGRSQLEISRTYENQPIASFYGWKTDGLYQTQSEIDTDSNIKNDSRKGNIKPGDVRFVDQNLDGSIDDKDRVWLGDPNPAVVVGLQLGGSYKNFDFSANFYGNFGVELYNSDRMQGLTPNTPYNYYAETLNRWHGEGTSNTIPRMTNFEYNNNHRVSDLFIENGNFFKLKNLTAGYTLPKSLLSKVKINSLRFYVSGEDLLILTQYKGFTPELGFTAGNLQRGVDVAAYPTVRKISLGLSLNF
ncbi:MAG: TonB-dependent receptor SusC [Candidatus Ordinivivax streblomastigis]|uniref:TonB-dependent receptor SusC n=1 Tax=Candidatus Ordinivivax streblomastigis TaxID=2540710 RepID=A0A5M8NUN1_9BACT|nr:MAG: TonB-dependent receptor SusC [Candidatus Ordinivivax streblomastigis]